MQSLIHRSILGGVELRDEATPRGSHSEANGAHWELSELERVSETKNASVTEGNADVRERQERLKKLRREFLSLYRFQGLVLGSEGLGV